MKFYYLLKPTQPVNKQIRFNFGMKGMDYLFLRPLGISETYLDQGSSRSKFPKSTV